MEYKKEQLKRILEEVIAEEASYCYFNKGNFNISKDAAGDLYTRLRRHFRHTFQSCILERDNISSIIIDKNTGKILYIEFVHRSFGSIENEKLVDALTEVLEEINPDFSLHLLNTELTTIINSVNNFEVT